jgi:hypothetical protein
MFFFHSGICFRCRLDNPRHFPNFQLLAIGVRADFCILHFLDNRRCSYTINFVQRKPNSWAKPPPRSPLEYGWRNENKYLMPKYVEGPMTFDFLQDIVCMCKGKFICSKNWVCMQHEVCVV